MSTYHIILMWMLEFAGVFLVETILMIQLTFQSGGHGITHRKYISWLQAFFLYSNFICYLSRKMFNLQGQHSSTAICTLGKAKKCTEMGGPLCTAKIALPLPLHSCPKILLKIFSTVMQHLRYPVVPEGP